MHRLARTLASVVAATAVIFGAGAAYGYLSSTGAGSGQAASGVVRSIDVQPDLHSAGLVPGGAPIALSGSLDNGDSGSVYVISVTVTILSVTKAAGAPAGTCNETDYGISGGTMSVETEIAGHAKIVFGGATISFVNKPVNQDACKLSTVNLSYTAI